MQDPRIKMAVFPGGSPGHTLGNPAGVIKPGKMVLVDLVRVVGAQGIGPR